jgi:hypothetical protein
LAEVSDDDIERLAARLAMLVSEDGEAEAAGRAVSHLTRRLGMTGGQLKEMFLAGASGRPAPQPPPPHPARPGEIDRLEREIAALRRGAREAENELRNAERERDMLASEVERVRSALFRAQSVSNAERIIGGIVLVAVLVAGAVSYVVPFGRTPAAPPPSVPSAADAMNVQTGPRPGDERPDVDRLATVRSTNTVVFAEPDQAAKVVARLTPGSSVVVHRVFWNMLLQWAEVDVGSGVGFVVTSDIDLGNG